MEMVLVVITTILSSIVASGECKQQTFSRQFIIVDMIFLQRFKQFLHWKSAIQEVRSEREPREDY